jgi:hypothetical protein
MEPSEVADYGGTAEADMFSFLGILQIIPL